MLNSTPNVNSLHGFVRDTSGRGEFRVEGSAGHTTKLVAIDVIGAGPRDCG
jgi:hypothetical protein